MCVSVNDRKRHNIVEKVAWLIENDERDSVEAETQLTLTGRTDERNHAEIKAKWWPQGVQDEIEIKQSWHEECVIYAAVHVASYRW